MSPHAARCENSGSHRGGGWSTDISCIQSFPSSQRSGPYAGFTEWDAAGCGLGGWASASCMSGPCKSTCGQLIVRSISIHLSNPHRSCTRIEQKMRLSGARPFFSRHWLCVPLFFLFSSSLVVGGMFRARHLQRAVRWRRRLVSQVPCSGLHVWAARFGCTLRPHPRLCD